MTLALLHEKIHNMIKKTAMTSRSIYFMQKPLNMNVYIKLHTLPMLNNVKKQNFDATVVF